MIYTDEIVKVPSMYTVIELKTILSDEQLRWLYSTFNRADWSYNYNRRIKGKNLFTINFKNEEDATFFTLRWPNGDD